MKASIYVTTKKEVLDPEGEAVLRALRSLEFDGVSNVRVGKLIQLELSDGDADEAHQALERMCQRLLANPVIEDYRIELVSDSGEGT